MWYPPPMSASSSKRSVEPSHPAAGPRNRWLSRLANLALLSIALLLAAIMGEVTIRKLEPSSDNQPLVERLPDSGRGWGLLPNRAVLRQGVEVHTNSRGQRGEDYLPAKPAGVFRIVGLGDSYTFGSGVEYEDTYLEVLEDLLTTEDLRCEAINFGIEGYNTNQAEHYFEEMGTSLSPDLVLLGYVYNDIEEGLDRGDAGGPSANPGAQGSGGRAGITDAILSLKRKSRLFSTLSPRIGALLRSFGVQGIGEVGGYVEAYSESSPGWKHSREAILRLRELADSCGARFAVLVLPAFVSLDRESYPLLHYHAAVTTFCQENQIPVLDLFPTFEGERAGQYWISINDPHPNGQGNRKIAEAVHSFLVEEGLVTENSPESDR